MVCKRSIKITCLSFYLLPVWYFCDFAILVYEKSHRCFIVLFVIILFVAQLMILKNKYDIFIYTQTRWKLQSMSIKSSKLKNVNRYRNHKYVDNVLPYTNNTLVIDNIQGKGYNLLHYLHNYWVPVEDFGVGRLKIGCL